MSGQLKSKIFLNFFLLGLLLLAAFMIRLSHLPAAPDHSADMHIDLFRYYYYGPFKMGLSPPASAPLSSGFFMFVAAAFGWLIAFLKYGALALSHIDYYQPFSSVLALSPSAEILLLRSTTVLTGTLLVYLAYRAGMVFFGRRSGWIAALLTAFSPFLINNSRLIGNDIALSVVIAAGLVSSAFMIVRGGLKWYLLSGFFAGLAAGMKLAGCSLLAVLFFSHRELGPERKAGKKSLRVGSLLAAIVFFIAGVLISRPGLWYSSGEFFSRMSESFRSPTLQGMLAANAPAFFWESLAAGARWGIDLNSGVGFLILAPALGGAVLILAEKKPVERCVLTAALAYCLLVILTPPFPRPADFLPLAFMLFLLAARFLVFLADFFRAGSLLKKVVTSLLVCSVIIPFLLVDLKALYFSRVEKIGARGRERIEEKGEIFKNP